MKCLLDRLETCESGDVLWIADPSGAIENSRLAWALRQVDPSRWRGKRVAIGALPVLELVAALVFLDGLAQAIILLPAEDDQTAREARLQQADIDIVVEVETFGFTELLTQSKLPAVCSSVQQPAAVRPPPIPTTWLLPTSGTTGKPKLIAHTTATLTRSMTKRRMAGEYTWGSLYSLRRFAGLQVFLQAWMCGTPLILNDEGAALHQTLTRFIDLGCNALSATPSMWRKLAMHPLFDRLSLKQITLGGEIVDQSTLDMLAKRFSAARITHIYASTEAGVGFAVRDGLAGFPVDFLLHPPLGVAMRIDVQSHLCFATSADRSSATNAEGGWIDSGDVVDVQANRIRFMGRANGSINVGGNKVMPEEVESVIKELNDVAFVQVRARKSAMLGSLVEAAVTPVPGTVFDAAFQQRVASHCRARLDGFKVPAFVVAADGIHLTAAGKLSRLTST